jgi:hypothetical protein
MLDGLEPTAPVQWIFYQQHVNAMGAEACEQYWNRLCALVIDVSYATRVYAHQATQQIGSNPTRRT